MEDKTESQFRLNVVLQYADLEEKNSSDGPFSQPVVQTYQFHVFINREALYFPKHCIVTRKLQLQISRNYEKLVLLEKSKSNHSV
jgi:hypothetical protein